MDLRIKKFIEFEAKDWDKFVYSNSMGWAHLLYDVTSIDRFSYWKNLSFGIVNKDNNDEIYMLVQLYKTPKNLNSRWGYILKDNLSKKQFNKVKICFQSYIQEIINKYSIEDFSISLPPLSEKNNPQNCSLVNPLIYFNFFPKLRYTSIIDLSKPDEKMLADCEETTRQAIQKLKKSDKYEIVESTGSKKDLEEYIKLHKETYTRTGAISGIINDKYHENMFFNLIPKGICRVFFLKNKQTKKYIASVAILIFKNTAYYWWGSSTNYKEIGINKYLLFNVICIVRESFNKTGYFETGGTYIYLRNGKSKGLTDYKKCFGTFLHPIYMGSYLNSETKIKTKNKLKKFILIFRLIFQ